MSVLLIVGVGCSPNAGGPGGDSFTGDGGAPMDESDRGEADDEGDGSGSGEPGSGADDEGDEGDGRPSAGREPVEVCGDGLDDDEDGRVDEGCACDTDETQRCYGGPIDKAGIGACEWGTQHCEDSFEFGSWGACEDWVPPSEEVCDGIDNNCDGTVDEGCDCTLGDTRDCYTGPEGTEGVGECRGGMQECVMNEDGTAGWSECTEQVLPTEEVCGDELDNDCDGEIDEGCIVDCTVADVLLLVDTTGSMGGEIGEIQTRLRSTIIPGLADEIEDVRFSVAKFDDFPVGSYGGSGDVPFELLQANTSSAMDAQSAVDRLRAYGGSDGPESQVEALYQVATGEGIGTWVPPASCPDGTVGYPCFRADATHVVLLITDAQFHNGPGGSYSYSGVTPTPHTYSETVDALTDPSMNAKVLGLFSGFSGRSDLESIARDTGAVRDGDPIVIDIGRDGSMLDAGVIEAVRELCRGS